MSHAVEDILERIDRLSDDDRSVFQEQLSRRLAIEWARETAIAREEAARRGIDQAAIDRVVDSARRGS